MSGENSFGDVMEPPVQAQGAVEMQAEQNAEQAAGQTAQQAASLVETVGDAARHYRHVEASHWLVHALLQYHYLPYWPRNVDRVFATVDITTGKVVAACVFAYPVLRCGLREQVFGLLAPEALNTHFRQLVRWMVHPDHRGDGVGTALLKWACTKMQHPVLEAINRKWVPVEAFKECGFVERSDQDRHYYYRLKECRKRVDEIIDPPHQAEARQGAVLHAYPRVWCAKLQLHGQSRIVFVQPYEGSPLRTHIWKDNVYFVQFDVRNTPETVEESGNYVEVTDEQVMAKIMSNIATGLPIANQG